MVSFRVSNICVGASESLLLSRDWERFFWKSEKSAPSILPKASKTSFWVGFAPLMSVKKPFSRRAMITR